MKGDIGSGDRLTMAAPANVTVGVPLLVGTLFCIPESTQLSGEQVSMRIRGICKVPKAASQAWTVGAKVYWDDTAKVLTTTAAANYLVGAAAKVAASAASGDGIIGYVALNGITVTVTP